MRLFAVLLCTTLGGCFFIVPIKPPTDDTKPAVVVAPDDPPGPVEQPKNRTVYERK